MLASLRERRNREDEGFTLIELMVVVLIIAILLAIAIPTFLGARERAQDRAAQSDIRNALAAEKVYYTDDEVYTDDTNGVITDIEPSLEYAAAATTDIVGLRVADAWRGAAAVADQAVCISKLSNSGAEFSMLEVAVGDHAGTWYYDVDDCNGESPNTATAPSGVAGGW